MVFVDSEFYVRINTTDKKVVNSLYHYMLRGPSTVDGIRTGYGLDGPRIESR